VNLNVLHVFNIHLINCCFVVDYKMVESEKLADEDRAKLDKWLFRNKCGVCYGKDTRDAIMQLIIVKHVVQKRMIQLNAIAVSSYYL
jgi:hypothetical protein